MISTKFVFLLMMFGTINAMQCPYQLRGKGTCCEPIECGRDFQYHLCNETAKIGKDWCEKCKTDEINPQIINTMDNRYSEYEINLCFTPICECTPEAVLVNETRCRSEGKNECMCDTEKGYWGENPLLCKTVNESMTALIKRPGFELTLSGQAEKCKEATFKSETDMSACKPHKHCQSGERILTPGNTTSDTVCELLPSVEYSVPPTQPTSNGSTNTTTTTPIVEDETLSGSVIAGIFIGVIAPILICILVCVRYRKYIDINRGFTRSLRNCKARRRILKPNDNLCTKKMKDRPNGAENHEPRSMSCDSSRDGQIDRQSEETRLLENSGEGCGNGQQNNGQAYVDFSQQNGHPNTGRTFPQQDGSLIPVTNSSNMINGHQIDFSGNSNKKKLDLAPGYCGNNVEGASKYAQSDTSANGLPEINISCEDTSRNLSDNESRYTTDSTSEDGRDETSSLESPLDEVDPLKFCSLLSGSKDSAASDSSSVQTSEDEDKSKGTEDQRPVAAVKPMAKEEETEVYDNIVQETREHEPYRPYINGQFIDK